MQKQATKNHPRIPKVSRDLKEPLAGAGAKLYEFSHNLCFSNTIKLSNFQLFMDGWDDHPKQMIGEHSLIIYGKGVKPTDNHFNKYYESLVAESQNNVLEYYDLHVKGRRQGEFVRVKFVGDVPDWLKDINYLENQLFYTPIDGEITILYNGEVLDKIPYDYFCKGDFDWDKDFAIKVLGDYVEGEDYALLLIEWLQDNLPETLDYDH